MITQHTTQHITLLNVQDNTTLQHRTQLHNIQHTMQ